MELEGYVPNVVSRICGPLRIRENVVVLDVEQGKGTMMKITGEIHRETKEKWYYTTTPAGSVTGIANEFAELLGLVLDSVPEGETKKFTVTIDVE